MLGILNRYLVFDLARLTILTTAILVTVIAFGAAIKPLSLEELLTPMQTLKYIAVATVPMMQFALPFAAGFAATVTFHRMASENEIVAMSAAGLSYIRLFMPVLSMGIVLALIMVILTQWVIPRFYGYMGKLLATDVALLLEHSIRQGVPFTINNLQIYADDMKVIEDPVDTEADTRLILYRVAAARIGSDKRPETDVTAAQAVVDVYYRNGRTYMKMSLTDAVSYSGVSGELRGARQIEPTRAIILPSFLDDNPRTMTRGQLLVLRQNPDDFDHVAVARLRLVDSIEEAMAWKEINHRLSLDHSQRLIGRGQNRYSYEVEADSLVNGVLEAKGQAVNVVQYDQGEPVRRFESSNAQLNRDPGSPVDSLSFNLIMRGATVHQIPEGGIINVRREQIFGPLEVPGMQEQGMTKLSSAELEEIVQKIDIPSEELALAAKRLRYRIAELQNEIESRLQTRYAISVTALLLVMLGMVLAIYLRNSLPLFIYLWAFIPALVDLLVISSGAQLMRDGQVIFGSFLMWIGNVVLLAAICFITRMISRH